MIRIVLLSAVALPFIVMASSMLPPPPPPSKLSKKELDSYAEEEAKLERKLADELKKEMETLQQERIKVLKSKTEARQKKAAAPPDMLKKQPPQKSKPLLSDFLKLPEKAILTKKIDKSKIEPTRAELRETRKRERELLLAERKREKEEMLEDERLRKVEEELEKSKHTEKIPLFPSPMPKKTSAEDIARAKKEDAERSKQLKQEWKERLEGSDVRVDRENAKRKLQLEKEGAEQHKPSLFAQLLMHAEPTHSEKLPEIYKISAEDIQRAEKADAERKRQIKQEWKEQLSGSDGRIKREDALRAAQLKKESKIPHEPSFIAKLFSHKKPVIREELLKKEQFSKLELDTASMQPKERVPPLPEPVISKSIAEAIEKASKADAERKRQIKQEWKERLSGSFARVRREDKKREVQLKKEAKEHYEPSFIVRLFDSMKGDAPPLDIPPPPFAPEIKHEEEKPFFKTFFKGPIQEAAEKAQSGKRISLGKLKEDAPSKKSTRFLDELFKGPIGMEITIPKAPEIPEEQMKKAFTLIKEEDQKELGRHAEESAITKRMIEKERESLHKELSALTQYLKRGRMADEERKKIVQAKEMMALIDREKEEIVQEEKKSLSEINEAVERIKTDKLTFAPQERVLDKERLITHDSQAVEDIFDRITMARESLMRLDVFKAKRLYQSVMKLYLSLTPEEQAKVYPELMDLYKERHEAEHITEH